MSKIKRLEAIEILDSRGNPTIKVSCFLEGGFLGEASVPSGKSTGVHEAVELRDGDTSRYNGLGVLQAVNFVNTEINNFLQNKDLDQNTLDKALIDLDGTDNKKRLGANSILGVSLAFARASAKEKGIELYQYLGFLVGNNDFKIPNPMLNILNGGKHGENNLDIQEFMIIPEGIGSFFDKIEASKKIIESLKKNLEQNNLITTLGDEGGFAPKLQSNEEALDLIVKSIQDYGFTCEDIKIGLDVASSSFYQDGVYKLKTKKQDKTNTEMISWYKELVEAYPIISIEDGLSEDDWGGFINMTRELGNKINIVGDDLTVTNVKKIQVAIEKNAVNSILIKLNQIGTLSETIEAINLTKAQGWTPIVSHRSGETMDTFIADLAVGLSCPFIKTGASTKPERMCKYDRLIEIERIIKKS